MKIQCPKCGQEYEVDESLSGCRFECPCGKKFESVTGKPETLPKIPDTRRVACPKCKHCFYEKKTEKKAVCPRCGTIFDNINLSELTLPRGCLLFSTGILIVFFLWLYYFGCSGPVHSAPVQKEEKQYQVGTNIAGAWTSAEEFVKRSLKSPSTAKFPSFIFHGEDVRIKHLGDDVYQVSSYVDSQNSFGAMLRSNFTLKVKYIKDRELWNLSGNVLFY